MTKICSFCGDVLKGTSSLYYHNKRQHLNEEDLCVAIKKKEERR